MTLENEKKRRRARGPSALGDFEQAKAAAQASIDEHVEERRQKTERLRVARMARASGEEGADGAPDL